MGVIVQVKASFDGVYLPDGRTYRSGRQITLSNAQYASLPDATLRAITVVQTGVPDPAVVGTSTGKVRVDTDSDGVTVMVVVS